MVILLSNIEGKDINLDKLLANEIIVVFLQTETLIYNKF